MNHCILEVEVKQGPTLRYTQDNKTPIAEMEVQFAGLRADDAPGELKVVGWGGMAEDLKNRAHIGQRLIVEGRLRMNTLSREDGTKEKRAELTLSRIHPVSAPSPNQTSQDSSPSNPPSATASTQTKDGFEKTSPKPSTVEWNSAPLIPDTDDIPF